MSPSAADEQRERRETLENDRRVREQQSRGSTYLDHHHSELGGRFGAVETETIAGRSSPQPPPLPASSPWSGQSPEPGIEPPLGYAIAEMVPLETPAETCAAGTGPASADAPSAVVPVPVDAPRAGAGSFSEEEGDDAA
jgi:hypothetical protein